MLRRALIQTAGLPGHKPGNGCSETKEDRTNRRDYPAGRKDRIPFWGRNPSTQFGWGLVAACQTWNCVPGECGAQKRWHECEGVEVREAEADRGRGRVRHSRVRLRRLVTGARLRGDATQA